MVNERSSTTPPTGVPPPQPPSSSTGEIEVTKAQLEEALAKLREKDEELAKERVS